MNCADLHGLKWTVGFYFVLTAYAHLKLAACCFSCSCIHF